MLDPGLTIFSELVTRQSDSMIQSLTDNTAHKVNEYKLQLPRDELSFPYTIVSVSGKKLKWFVSTEKNDY